MGKTALAEICVDGSDVTNWLRAAADRVANLARIRRNSKHERNSMIAKHFECSLSEVTTETGRLRIQRQEWQLIAAPNINDFHHMALFVKSKSWTHVVTFLSPCWLCRYSLLCGLHEVYSRTMLRPDLFIYLFICVRESRACHVVLCLRRNCTLGSSNFFKWSCQELVRHRPGFTWFNWVRVIFSGDCSITRVGSPRTSQQKQTQLALSLSSSNIFLAIVSRVGRTRQQTQTRLGLSLSSSNFSGERITSL